MNTMNSGNTVNGLWQPVCHVPRSFQSTWLAVAEHPCAFSSTRGEALRCRARRGLGRESLNSGAATAPKILGAAEWHRALSRPTAAGDGASASNLKKPHCVPQASIQHTGEKGVHGGKSEVSPRAPCAWRSKKKQSTFPSAGNALGARHRVRAREYGLVRTCTDLYGRLAHGCVGALCPGNSIAHGTQAAIDHLQYSRYSQYSWFLCSHPVPCAMCPASGLATPEQSGGGRLESPSGRQPTVTEADVRPARHFCRRIYKTSCRKRATSGPHRAMLYSSPRL